MHVESFFNMWLNLYANKMEKYFVDIAELIKTIIDGVRIYIIVWILYISNDRNERVNKKKEIRINLYKCEWPFVGWFKK